eukprot:tig00021795_g23522.t1
MGDDSDDTVCARCHARPQRLALEEWLECDLCERSLCPGCLNSSKTHSPLPGDRYYKLKCGFCMRGTDSFDITARTWLRAGSIALYCMLQGRVKVQAYTPEAVEDFEARVQGLLSTAQGYIGLDQIRDFINTHARRIWGEHLPLERRRRDAHLERLLGNHPEVFASGRDVLHVDNFFGLTPAAFAYAARLTDLEPRPAGEKGAGGVRGAGRVSRGSSGGEGSGSGSANSEGSEEGEGGAARPGRRSSRVYEVERVLGKRFVAGSGEVEYKIRWRGFKTATWNEAAGCDGCPARIEEYEAAVAAGEPGILRPCLWDAGAKRRLCYTTLDGEPLAEEKRSRGGARARRPRGPLGTGARAGAGRGRGRGAGRRSGRALTRGRTSPTRTASRPPPRTTRRTETTTISCPAGPGPAAPRPPRPGPGPGPAGPASPAVPATAQAPPAAPRPWPSPSPSARRRRRPPGPAPPQPAPARPSRPRSRRSPIPQPPAAARPAGEQGPGRESGGGGGGRGRGRGGGRGVALGESGAREPAGGLPAGRGRRALLPAALLELLHAFPAPLAVPRPEQLAAHASIHWREAAHVPGASPEEKVGALLRALREVHERATSLTIMALGNAKVAQGAMRDAERLLDAAAGCACGALRDAAAAAALHCASSPRKRKLPS